MSDTTPKMCYCRRQAHEMGSIETCVMAESWANLKDQRDRLRRIADAGAELKDWAHTASALVQWCANRGMEDAERTIGPLREAIAEYEEASRGA